MLLSYQLQFCTLVRILKIFLNPIFNDSEWPVSGNESKKKQALQWQQKVISNEIKNWLVL